jgi:hypothetical protein
MREAGEADLLTSGDWDGDGNRDLAVGARIFGDTSCGNKRGFLLYSLIIFWGSESGAYSIDDTTHLICGGEKSFGLFRALGTDLNGDGIDDLLIWGGGRLENGAPQPTAQVFVFSGRVGSRWGRNDIPRMAEVQWWNVPPFNYLQLTDQDCDGYKDVAFINQTTNYYSYVSIIYGKPGVLLDTTNIEKLDMTSSGAHYALFSDVTGDGVPELTANCDGEKLEVFAGRPAQRLVEQYGSGNDAKNGRPWAEVWLPRRIHDGWSGAGGSPLYDMGDLGREGVSDLWTYSWPFIIGYIGGKALDSSIDAEFDTRGYGDFAGITRLGDIDGSGLSSFAITFALNPGSIMFFKPLGSLPVNGNVRRTLPHPVGFRCEHAAGVEQQVPPECDRPRLSVARPVVKPYELHARPDRYPVPGLSPRPRNE